MSYDYEVAIIGGGPAGSTAALYLSRKGFKVCVFEKKIYPRETVCGEFLSQEVSRGLKELNLFEKFKSLQPNKINSFRFINNDGQDISASLNFEAYSLKRSTFDQFLLNQAEENGAEIIQPAEVKEIINQENHFKLIIKSYDSSKVVYAKNVIAAYGRQNILDRQLRRNFVKKGSCLTGVKFHIEEKFLNGFNKNEIRIYSGKHIYCGINAVNDNMITLCFLEDRSSYSKPVKEHLTELAGSNIRFGNLFTKDFTINKSAIYGTGNIFFGKRNIIENGVYMIGDAAGIIAPLSGDGIGIAFESAKAISGILTEEKEKKYNTIVSQRKYTDEWSKLFDKRIFTAGLVQNYLLKSYLRNTGFLLLKIFPGLLNYFIRTTRT